MEFNRVDTERAYHLIREKIITLDLAPGSPVDIDQLVEELQTAPSAVPEALRLLAHEGLVALPPDGIFVGEVSLPDLRQLSELRRTRVRSFTLSSEICAPVSPAILRAIDNWV